MYYTIDFSELNGKHLVATYGEAGDDSVKFECSDGSEYLLYHVQDCCESVYLEDIVGDIGDLYDAEVISAEEVDSGNTPPIEEKYGGPESYTWTFYKIQTNKGAVTLRFYGTSNGYYSERVNFKCTRGPSP